MAWRNIILTSYQYQSEITNLELCSLSSIPGQNQLPNYISYSPNTRSEFPVGTKLCGDDNNYIMATKNGNFYNLGFYYNGSLIGSQEMGMVDNRYLWSYIAGVDDETGKAYFLYIYSLDGYNWIATAGGNMPPFSTSGQTPTFNDKMYAILTGAEYHQYTWESVPAISGKGKTTSLSMIRNENLGDGSPVTGGSMSTINRLTPESSLNGLLTTMGPSVGQKTILYSGEFKRLDAFLLFVPPATLTATLKFYLQPGTGGVENLAYQYSINSTDWANTYVSIIKDDENEVACLSIIHTYKENQIEYVDYNTPGNTMSSSEMHDLWLWLQGGDSETDGDGIDNFTDNDPNGGGGSLQRFNNPVPEPGLPGKNGLDLGFMSLWYMTTDQLQALSAYMWSDDFIDIIEKRLFVDPKDAIVNLMIMPYEPPHSGEPSLINFMGYSTGKYGYRILDRWEKLPASGSWRVTIPRLLTNGWYLDYAPFTSCKVWLPFCGEHELDISDVMGKTLDLKYLVDTLTGVCVANLTIINPEADDETEGTHYYFSGQMGVKIPVSASDYSSLYNALISIGATVATAGALGMAGELTAPVQIGMVATSATNVANMAPKCVYSSGGGAIEGALSGEYPFLIISEPIAFEAENQRKYIGYPCFSTYSLANCSGYTKVLNIHLDNIPCTESEREQIRNLLTSGVIIQTGTVISTADITPVNADNLVVLFLKNLSDKEEFGKTFKKVDDHLDAELIEGKLLFDQSIERPVMIIDGNVSDYNYMYIPEFKRFYYITDIEYKAGGVQYVHGEVDPLQSFKTEILSNEAIIADTNEARKAKFLCNNNSWFSQQNKHVLTLTFKDAYRRNAGFPRGANSSESYVLTIAGT